METNKELVDSLNELVTINNDRVEGYKTALKETEDNDLKEVFKEMAEHSMKFRTELSDQIFKAGGEPESGTKTTGKFYRAWMDFKAALTRKDRVAILSSCEYGEDVALECYEDVLRNGPQSGEVRKLLIREKEVLRQDHDKIKMLRDSNKR